MTSKADQINALKRFKTAYYALSVAWDRKDSNLNDVDAIRHYPFDKSFDELNVPGWVDAMINELAPVKVHTVYESGDLTEKELRMLSMIVRRFSDEIDFLTEEEVNHLITTLRCTREAREVKDFHNYLIEAMPDGPNSTPEEQEAFDEAWEKFYETPFTISFGGKSVTIANDATIYNGILDTLKELIDYCL